MVIIKKREMIDMIKKYEGFALENPVKRPNYYHYSFFNLDLSIDYLNTLTVKMLTKILSDIKFEYDRGGYRKGLNSEYRHFTQGPYILGNQIFKSKAKIKKYISSVLSRNINKYFKNDIFKDILKKWNREFEKYGYSISNQFLYIDNPKNFKVDISDFNTKMIETRNHPILLMYVPELDDYVSVSVYQFNRDVSYGTYKYDLNHIFELYRDKCYELELFKPYYYMNCQYPNCNENKVEYHHHNPTFKHMMDYDILPLISDEDFVSGFGYKKFDRNINSRLHYLNNKHPSVTKLKKLHQNNKYYMLCKKHHYQVEQSLKKGECLLEK